MGAVEILDPQADPFLRPDVVAARWKLDRKTVLGAIKAGDIPATRVGRSLLIPTAWVLAQEQREPVVMPPIVATATSRGGQLGCGHRALPGERIFKVDTGERGGTTRGGNGLGSWVCADCAAGNADS